MEKISIHTPFIKLDQAIKLAGWVGYGSDAKLIIQNEEIMVNGEICSQRGKKLHHNDIVTWENEQLEFQVEENNSEA